MLDKMIDSFADEYIKKSPHASKEEVKKVLEDFSSLMKKNKDASPEEIVECILEDCIKDLNDILKNYSTPGIASSLNVDNIHINLYGGTIRPAGDNLTENALFDIASITKLYTEIIAYKLINQGAFSLFDKIGELDPRFENMKGVMVSDVLRFVVSFQTDGRIEDAVTRSEAEQKLFDMKVSQLREQYNYNDMGLMMLKEVMEYVTGKTYAELFEEYITIPYGLPNTYLVVPNEKKSLVTGTPNLDGSVNDLKANVLGGYSGHAGVRATNQDLLQFMEKIVQDRSINKGMFDANRSKSNRSEKMGNAYVNPELFINPDGSVVSGAEKSYFGKLAPASSIAAQGSTRVILRASEYNGIIISSTALSNIASMTDEEMLKMIERENTRRLSLNPDATLLNSEVLMKVRIYDGKTFKMHDPRSLMNEDETLTKLLYKYDNEVVLKLLFLNKLLKELEHYHEDVNVNQDISQSLH